jgi:integrase/recombinase XerD
VTSAVVPPTHRGDRLDDVLDEHQSWLSAERGLRPNTLAAYRRDLRSYAAFLRGRGIDDLARVDEDLVLEYAANLRDAVDDDGRARYSPASIARSLVAVRSLHRFCVDEGMATADPTEGVRGPRVPLGIPKALTEHEVERLLGAPSGDAPSAWRDRAMLEVLYAGGLRISELAGLDRADADLDDGLVRVLGKGGKERVVPIGQLARQAIGDYLVRGRPALARDTASGRRAGDALFLNGRGGRLTRQGCWGIVRTAARRVGLEDKVSPHVLRHSCATHLLDHGADIRVVQEVLGHASISTTQVYTLVSPERLHAAYRAAHPRSRSR